MDGSTLMPVADHAMYIVTARRARDMSGCLVGFVTQCSIHPPRYIACISVQNHTYPVARAAEVLAVHMVSDARGDLAELFGGETGDRLDKFAECDWSVGPHGAIVLAGLRNWFVGAILTSWPVGDHRAFLLDPLAWSFDASEEPLVYRRVAAMTPGHRP